MGLDEIIRALGARRSGSGWVARCPAHEDRNPSLSIRDDAGKLLVHCHAGCAQRDVVNALKARGLWPTTPSNRDRGRIAASYDYTDASGQLLYQIVRFEPKDFSQRRPDGRGRWIWKKHPHQVLYHLPEVLEAAIVFVVEGERDVETLRSWGFVATTNAGGSDAPWLPQFSEALRGREVILMPDADQPGRARVLRIARALLGIAARIIVLELAGAKDITEWFERGHREVELIALVEEEEEEVAR
jgi:5S rRNA maturation endonuclease (ribonuclease M5)